MKLRWVMECCQRRNKQESPGVEDSSSIIQVDAEKVILDWSEITTQDIMFCWGGTVHGELGLGGIEEDQIFQPREHSFQQANNVSSVACGYYHTVMITNQGKVYSCGNNDHGQLGHQKSRTKPELVEGLDAYQIAVAACGGNHTLAFNEWGQLFGWGSDVHGQLGLNVENQAVPKIVKTLATTHVVQVSCGQNHSLALTSSGELYAWGGNSDGQLGIGTAGGNIKEPSIVKTLQGVPISFIACGSNHSMAISKSGAIYGWGKNTFGQLGLNDRTSRKTPSELKTLRTIGVCYISGGEDFTAFLTSDGGVFTCGAGMYGQLGHGSTSNEILPKKVMELMGSVVTQISCGRRHTLALVPSRGRVYAFGLGGSGQLGTRSNTNSSTPQVVLGPWVSPSGVAIIANGVNTETCKVTKIFAGGDQCFVTVAPYKSNTPPSDFRILNSKFQILCVEEEKISQCAKIPADATADQDLLEYLETVFKSEACINSSFLLSNHFCCTSKNNGIDMSKAERVFGNIAKVEYEGIKDVIWENITETLLDSLQINPIDTECLRIYLILPLYHQFENPKNCIKLQAVFANKFLNLPEESKKIVGSWLCECSTEYFERLIRIFKDVVAYFLRPLNIKQENIFFPEAMLAALNMLNYLNKLNHSLDSMKVSYDSFYLPELHDVIDVRIDYVRWLTDNSNNSRKLFFCDYAFLFDARAKTLLLQADQTIQMQRAMNEATSRMLTQLLFGPSFVNPEEQFLYLTVNREHIVQNALDQLRHIDAVDLKKPLKVKFIDEEAEDAGGVRKEFFMLVFKEVLDPKYGMFKHYDETRSIWFSEDSFEDEQMYVLIGQLSGLAIYNFTIVDLHFPLVLYKKLLSEKVTLQDVKGLSPTLAKSLQDVLDYDGDDIVDVFNLTFEVTREVFGEVKSVPLKQNGDKIPVTQQNKKEFVDLYVDMLLNKSVETHYKAFHQGFHKVCGGRVLKLFHAQELMTLVVGNENYDWEEFERNAEYKGGYSQDDPTIKLFWEVFHELPLEEKKNFLLFLTGSDRIPIMGMKAIKIFIQPTTDDKYLPVAHTCFNLIDLPRYQTKERLRYKLLQAIKQNVGFSLV